jgi:hypothetical protein
MKNTYLLPTAGIVLIMACGPKSTIIPQDLDEIEKIKPAMEKLSYNDIKLLEGYLMRKAIGAAMGAVLTDEPAEPGIPKGMTIGKAIAEQKKFMAEIEKEEKQKAEARAKVEKESELAMGVMRSAVSVEFVSKRIVPADKYGFDQNLEIVFEYRNNTDKEIMGVKGRISIIDMFGKEITALGISNEETIPPKGSINWHGTRSVSFGGHPDGDKRWVSLPGDKFKVAWEPTMVVFKDGTKLTAPELDEDDED